MVCGQVFHTCSGRPDGQSSVGDGVLWDVWSCLDLGGHDAEISFSLGHLWQVGALWPHVADVWRTTQHTKRRTPRAAHQTPHNTQATFEDCGRWCNCGTHQRWVERNDGRNIYVVHKSQWGRFGHSGVSSVGYSTDLVGSRLMRKWCTSRLCLCLMGGQRVALPRQQGPMSSVPVWRCTADLWVYDL